MDYYLNRDEKFRKPLSIVKIIYVLTGIAIVIYGITQRSSYIIMVAGGTVFLIPGIFLVRKLFHVSAGLQMETYIYIFSYLGWSLGGAAMVYDKIPQFDKLVHTLSGGFVSMIMLCLYLMLERGNKKQNPATKYFFVGFGSVAVAGLFELCEFALAPIMQRDLQHVNDTGVTDTMMDIIVCTVGTIITLIVMGRSERGKHDPFTDAAMGFVCRNPLKK